MTTLAKLASATEHWIPSHEQGEVLLFHVDKPCGSPHCFLRDRRIVLSESRPRDSEITEMGSSRSRMGSRVRGSLVIVNGASVNLPGCE